MKLLRLVVLALLTSSHVGLWTTPLLARENDTNDDDINSYLKRFDEHPAEAMKETPKRWDGQGRPVKPAIDLRFPQTDIESGAAIKAKDDFRAKMCARVNGKMHCLGKHSALENYSVIDGNDLPEDLVDVREPVRSIKVMDSRGLWSAALSINPWSSSYWPLYKGGIGARYADHDFPFGEDWLKNYDYILKYPAVQIIQSNDINKIDLLSPSEKYEMLIGTSSSILTSHIWQMGKEFYKSNGYVEKWLGICDGWAQAAMMLPRPQKTLTLRAADEKNSILFYPSDIKALASYLWFKGQTFARFIGGRCTPKDPSSDENGRIIAQECFDTNPGAWHVAVVNQIGIARRSFLLDATYDYEVWNQPAFSYKYTYFNPRTKKKVNKLEEAWVPIGHFIEDKFRSYRSVDAIAIVGIVMNFTYLIETRPNHSKIDSPEKDEFFTVQYYYDVEVDSSNNIIGGEWYNNNHPDFLWVPVAGTHARSISEDEAVGTWMSPDTVLPLSWQSAAIHAAKKHQALGKIIEKIVEWATPLH